MAYREEFPIFNPASAVIGGIAGKTPEFLSSDNANVGGMYVQPKGQFWHSQGGKIISSLLGMLALGGLGAGIGAISSPKNAGLGAARGAGFGLGAGLLKDLALRSAGAQAPANNAKMSLEMQKSMPEDLREYSMAHGIPLSSIMPHIDETGKMVGGLGSEDIHGLEKWKFLGKYPPMGDPYASTMLPLLGLIVGNLKDKFTTNPPGGAPSPNPTSPPGTPAKKGGVSF